MRFTWLLCFSVGCFGGSSDKKADPDASTADASTTDGSIVDGALPDASIDANPAAPTCLVTMPANNSNTAYDVAVTLKATATDPEDGPLTGASVVWRTNLSTTPLGSGDQITTTLPPGANTVTCTATDSSTLTGTGTVNILSRSPFAQINHPGNNEMRPASQGVPFVGVARDKEDGTLSGTSLVWTSNLDGALNTGTQFTKNLSVGTHTITLTATDSNSNTDVATITLIMQ